MFDRMNATELRAPTGVCATPRAVIQECRWGISTVACWCVLCELFFVPMVECGHIAENIDRCEEIHVRVTHVRYFRRVVF